ncbi:MAG: hypothetical protein VX768_08645 [Planctomycetota bacterium]|nr:hypothetical protein [Planctomycetota bacterium]
MAKIRRIIHSVEKPASAGFDSQYWPILIAIAILFGFLMGTVLTLLSGIWLWFSLLSIPVLLFTTSIALRFVDDRKFKRSSQLALIVSLIVHLAMLLSAHHWQLFGEAEQTADSENEQKQVEKRQNNLPIVFKTRQWQQSQERMTPQPEQQQVEQQKTERQREPEKQETPTPVDKSQRQVTQNQETRKQTRQTVPRQSRTLSKLSRSKLNAEPNSGSRVSPSRNNSSQNNPQASLDQPARLTARKTNETRRQPDRASKPNPSRTDVSQEKNSTSDQTSVNRRQVSQDLPQPQDQNANSTPRRSRSNPTPNPAPSQVAKSSRSAEKTPRPSARPSAPPTLNPTQTDIAKTSRNRQTDQPTQRAPAQSNAQRQRVQSELASRRPNNEPNPKISQSPTSRSRTSNPTKVPNTTVMESAQSVVQAPKTSPNLNPQATNATITRNRQIAAQPTRIQIEAPQQQMSAATHSATRSKRRPDDSLPSINPTTSARSNPRRSNNTAAQVASRTNVETPSRETSPSRIASSDGQPRQTTLQKSTTGTAGVGQSANLLADAPTSPKPSMVASDAAVRRTATRKTPVDSAFQPTQSAQVRRSLTDRNTPAAEMRVENSPNASFAGSANPAQLNAQSSASQVQASSNAREGRVNAAQGSSTLDTGATKLVSEAGQGRASGGGQPEVDREIRTSASQKKRNGETRNSSLAANLKADVTEAPAETGGGRPSSTQPDPNASSLAKTLAGEGNRAAAGPTSAATTGPTQEESSAPSKSSATLATAAPRETAEGELTPGGGNPAENPNLRRTRAQLAGGSANTEVTFSGKQYASREEGAQGDAASNSAQVVGESDTTIESRSTSNTGGVGNSQASRLLAGGSEKSDSSLDSGTLQRQESSESTEPADGIGSRGQQLASRRRPGGAAGPNTNATVQLPGQPGGGSAAAGGGSSDDSLAGLAGNGDVGIRRREQTGGQMVNLDAQEGPGGLGREVEANTGINSRRARQDSTSIQLKVDTRFQRTDAGGDPKINTRAVFSKGAFKGRDKGKAGASGPSTEPSIEMGLAWLKKQQRSPGNWSLTVDGASEEEIERIVYDTPTAATGLALLAFQGAGYNHREYKYAETVNRGVQWLINNQQDDGCLYIETNQVSNDVCRLYSHGIATIALCEAYGMTNDPEVKIAAQKAVDYIAASQDETHGGWRYIPGFESDTSVTGWMVMALKSGKLAGLNVNPETLKRVDRWLGFSASRKNEHRFSYNPNARNTEQYPDREVKGKTPTACMTSVGLLLRLYSGWDRNDERMVAGAKELLKMMPSEESIELRNTYYWYYATQVLKHVGGEYWDTWYRDSLYPLLIRSQEKSGPMQGSWDPIHPVPDRWGYFSGRLYVTTLNLLTLEVKWRLLPLYDDTAK